MKRGHVAIRSCRGCGKKAPKDEMQRFVVEHGALVETDQGRGYGIYCCPDPVCRKKLQKNLTKRKIGRADTIREDGSN